MKSPLLPNQKANEAMQSDGHQLDSAQADNPQSHDFQSWIDGIPGAVFQLVTTLEGLVIAYPYVSSGCYKLLDVPIASGSSSPQKPAHCLFDAIRLEDRDPFQLAIARAAQSPHLWEWEGRIALVSGKTKWIALTVAACARTARSNHYFVGMQ